MTHDLTDDDLDHTTGGLLLPAVQAAREAIRRHPLAQELQTSTSTVLKKKDDQKHSVIGKV